jgi:hypothetical protein
MGFGSTRRRNLLASLPIIEIGPINAMAAVDLDIRKALRCVRRSIVALDPTPPMSFAECGRASVTARLPVRGPVSWPVS